MESRSNIRFVCDKHSSKPDKKFSKLPLESFIGKYVKKAFDVILNGRLTQEHMWVKVKRVEKEYLVGVLDNDPHGKINLKCGDSTRVQLDEIEAVLD